jgi:hypothetical protein
MEGKKRKKGGRHLGSAYLILVSSRDRENRVNTVSEIHVVHV